MNSVFVELGGLGEVALSITHHARRPLATDEPDDGATAWESALIAVTDDEVEHRVAHAETFVIHASRLGGWSILDVLDEISRDLASYTELFDDDGEIAAEFVDSYGGGLIVADRVTVDPAYRGRGLGPLLLAHALADLGAGCELAVCTPAPFEQPTGHDFDGGQQVLTDAVAAQRWAQRQEELRALWSRLGFERFRGTDIYTLELFLPTLEEALAQITDSVYGELD
ncbi:MAG TPA: GNAT family N-acetyltransferase [Ilumatobacteraceae bacterium]|nr:GNAT family N-acetyltransferase [Ilumatobacteraceae bacterium]